MGSKLHRFQELKKILKNGNLEKVKLHHQKVGNAKELSLAEEEHKTYRRRTLKGQRLTGNGRANLRRGKELIYCWIKIAL